jgi:hypothetical protein
MTQRTFEHEIFIRVPSHVVYSFLAAQVNHLKIHPLITAIEPLPDDPNRPNTRRYQITDRLKFAFFNGTIKYEAAVTPLSTNELLLEATQAGLYLRNVTRCLPDANGTRVHEFVTLNASPLLIGYAYRQAKTSHADMLVRLKAYLENGAAS